MLAPATMRLCNNAILTALFAGAALTLAAQQASSPPAAAQAPSAAGQAPSLTVDRDPARSPDAEGPSTTAGTLRKQGEGYVLHTDVEEVVLNCTVLEGNKLVPDLKRDDRSEEH